MRRNVFRAFRKSSELDFSNRENGYELKESREKTEYQEQQIEKTSKLDRNRKYLVRNGNLEENREHISERNA